MTTPYIGFGNDTLSRQPAAKENDMIRCPRCLKRHKLSGAKDAEGNPTAVLLFYKCGKHSYLAAVAGRSVIGVKADVKGDL